jgi:hypothetical protein
MRDKKLDILINGIDAETLDRGDDYDQQDDF